MTRPTPDIAFIGAGNMSRSLAAGLLRRGHPAERLRAADPEGPARDAAAALGIEVTQDNAVAAGADVLVLAVKPQVMEEVALGLAPVLPREHPPLVISVAAGVPLARLAAWLDRPSLAMVRAMPNTPALLGCGATGLYANAACGQRQRALAEEIMSAVGSVEWLAEEALLDAVTAISGSGPAYFFLLIELLGELGEELGLERVAAERLARQTALGAARMACESGVDPGELRRRVTSPGGTTAAALASLERAGIRDMFRDAVTAARDRARALGKPSQGSGNA